MSKTTQNPRIYSGSIKIYFPNFSMARLLSEACAEWSQLNGEVLCPDKGQWSQICDAVVTMLRHRFSDYDAIVTAENRDALRKQILIAARKQYLWLRPETDPRKDAKEPKDMRHYNVLSRALADLHGEKDRILLALGKTDGAERRSLRTTLAKVQKIIDYTNEQCGDLSADRLRFLSCPEHPVGEYNLDGLPHNKIKSIGIKCPVCGMSVMRSNQPVDFGAGIKLVLVSCHCHSVAVTGRLGKYRLKVTAKAWHDEVLNEESEDLSR